MHDLRAAKILVLAALAMVLVLTTNFSTAAFTSSSTSTATVRAAADWTPPTVKMGVLAALVRGDVTVTADASDRDSGVQSVTIERSASGAIPSQTICARTASPVSCTWNTQSVSDGTYELHASARDRDGNVAQTPATSVKVDNTPPVVTMVVPIGTLSGFRNFTAPVSDANGIGAVKMQYAPTGTTAWADLCTPAPAATGGSWFCSVQTANLKNGNYDFLAIATDTAGNETTSATVRDRTVRNAGPSVSIKNLGPVLAKTVDLQADATSDVGVSSVEFEYAAAGTTVWKRIGTDATAPYALPWDTMSLADGWYDVRAIATDAAGNRTTSPVVSGRLVDNAGPSVTLENPGSVLTGKVKLAATAQSLAGVTSVQFQYAPNGTTAWKPLATDTSAPYSFEWDTATVDNGQYDLRVVMTDGIQREVAALRTGHQVSNVPLLRAHDIQTTNGPGSAGDIDDGDLITLTYRGKIDLSMVLAGWNWSSPTAPSTVNLRFTDVRESEALTFTAADGRGLNLGSVRFQNGDHLKEGTNLSASGLMTAATETVKGELFTIVTVKVDRTPGNNSSRQRPVSSSAGTMVWTPCTSGNDLAGRACLPSVITETGALDVDF